MTSGRTVTYQFGIFRLDPAERLLLRGGQPVSLTPKAFDLLVYLVEHQGKLVEKSTLMATLWPDTIVEEANLAFQISALRKALDDGGNNGTVIQTVPTRGYRFVAEVTPLVASAPAADATTSREGATIPTPALPSHPLARRLALGLLALLLVAAAAYLLVRPDFPRARRTALQPQRPMRLVPITALTGWQDWPSLSPDGEHVAFEWAGDRNDNHDIYVTIVGSRDVRRLTTHPAADFAPSWSPNGREIAFLRTENGATRIHVMSALGGPDRTLSDFPAWASIGWSPDARFIVAGRVAERDPDRGIYLVPVSGGTPRAIERLRAPAESHAPAFSPDGHRLAYARCENIDTEGNSLWAERGSQGCQVRLVDVDEGYAPQRAPRRLPVGPMSTVGALAWGRDGESIVFWGHLTKPGAEQSGDSDEFADRLWRISPDGVHAPERIEVAGLNARRPTTSISRDRVVFSRQQEDLDVFRLVRGREPERLLTSAFFDAHSQFSLDGRRIAFCSDRTGTMEIWVAEADGSSERQLTRGPTLYQGSPRWSPDGSLVAFDAQEANGDRHIWIIPAEGGAARQLTKEPGDHAAPTWSHDGQWIYFTRVAGRRHEVWRVAATGGTPRQISRGGSGVVAFESPDGEHVIYKSGDEDTPLIQAALTGDSAKTLVPCVSSYWGFSVIGKSLYYMPCAPARAGTIRVLDLATRRDQLWTVVPDVSLVPNAESAYLWDLAISPDGTSLLYDRPVSFRANLWMLENFR